MRLQIVFIILYHLIALRDTKTISASVFFLHNLSLFYLYWLANYCINLMILMKLNSLMSLQSCGALQEFKNHGNLALTF